MEIKVRENNRQAVTPGQEVYVRVFGDGPFIAVENVGHMKIDCLTPIKGEKNLFDGVQHHVEDSWLVRDKNGSYLQLPESVLTSEKPNKEEANKVGRVEHVCLILLCVSFSGLFLAGVLNFVRML